MFAKSDPGLGAPPKIEVVDGGPKSSPGLVRFPKSDVVCPCFGAEKSDSTSIFGAIDAEPKSDVPVIGGPTSPVLSFLDFLTIFL